MEEFSCRALTKQARRRIEHKLLEKRWIFHEEDEGKNQQAHVEREKKGKPE